MYTKLDVFDFDSTLINTPMESDETKQQWADYHGVEEWPFIAWWTRKESLDMDVFEFPTNPEIIKAYRKSKSDPDTLTIMLTGRVSILEPQVRAILDSYGLTFDRYFFKEGGLDKSSSLAYYSIESKWRANAIYLRLPANTARAQYATGLWFTTSGAKWWHNPR